MKINKILFKIILLTIMIAICNSCMCYALNDAGGAGGGYDGGGTLTPEDIAGGSVGLPNLNNYGPSVDGDGKIIEITEKLLGIIIAVGAICITVFIALTGFGMILGSAEEKAVAKEKFAGYLIAAVILTGGATIAKVIISIAETFK